MRFRFLARALGGNGTIQLASHVFDERFDPI